MRRLAIIIFFIIQKSVNIILYKFCYLMNSGAKVRRFWRISVLNFSCRMEFFGTKVLFYHIISVYLQAKSE
jgi:hypothetical protein